MALGIKSIKLKDTKFDNWYSEIENRWDYKDFIRNETWRKDWISFDCLVPASVAVICNTKKDF